MKNNITGGSRIILRPNQLVVRECNNGTDSYIYADVFDIIGQSNETYDKFLNVAYQLGIFNYSNGRTAWGRLSTYTDGRPEASWFMGLCRMCYEIGQNGIDIRFKFDKTYMIDSDTKRVNATYTESESFSDSEAENIIDSYIWYMKKAIEACKIKTVSKTNGRLVYPIDIVQDRFLISSRRRLEM